MRGDTIMHQPCSASIDAFTFVYRWMISFLCFPRSFLARMIIDCSFASPNRKVYLSSDKQTGENVAVKKVLITTGKEGFPQTAVREIKLLASLRHENIIRLKEIVTPADARDSRDCDTIFLIFEYMDHDLAGLLRDPRVSLTDYQIKW